MSEEPPSRLRELPSWLLLRLSRPANRLVADALGHPDARADYAVLASLVEFGAMSQAELGRRLGADRSDVAAHVARLDDAGSISRAPDPADRRRNVVAVTAAGRRTLDAMHAQVEEAQDRLLAPLGPARRAELLATLQVLVEHHRGR